MSVVLLAGKDWKARALLRAQLTEEGLEIEAHDSVARAVESLEGSVVLPALLIADLTASDDPANETEELAQWAPQLPVWIIANSIVLAQPGLRGRGFELILTLPLDLGELVEQIKRRVQDNPEGF